MYLEISKSKEHQEAFDWFSNLINNSLVSANPNAQAVAHHLLEWRNILDNPVDPKVVLPPAPRASVKRKKKVRAKKDEPFECATHPTYGGKRRPRTDCKRCWHIYEQLHPLDYAKVRRDFERKMSAST